jgi:hypothetical protein
MYMCVYIYLWIKENDFVVVTLTSAHTQRYGDFDYICMYVCIFVFVCIDVYM